MRSWRRCASSILKLRQPLLYRLRQGIPRYNHVVEDFVVTRRGNLGTTADPYNFRLTEKSSSLEDDAELASAGLTGLSSEFCGAINAEVGVARLIEAIRYIVRFCGGDEPGMPQLKRRLRVASSAVDKARRRRIDVGDMWQLVPDQAEPL